MGFKSFNYKLLKIRNQFDSDSNKQKGYKKYGFIAYLKKKGDIKLFNKIVCQL